MNPQIQYLNMLRDRNVISERDYLFRLDAAYRTNPVAFKDEDVNFIENKFKKYDIDFEPAPPPGEQSVGSILNQAVSGIAEGFTTLGWAEDPDTTGERLAKNIGHLIGFAPDIIAGVLTSGASLTATSAKLAGKVGLRKTGQRLATSSVKMSGAGRAYQKQLGDMAQKLTIGNFNLSKNVGGQTLLRSLPLRAADWMIDTAKGKLGQNNLMAAGFFNKGVLGNKKFKRDNRTRITFRCSTWCISLETRTSRYLGSYSAWYNSRWCVWWYSTICRHSKAIKKPSNKKTW